MKKLIEKYSGEIASFSKKYSYGITYQLIKVYPNQTRAHNGVLILKENDTQIKDFFKTKIDLRKMVFSYTVTSMGTAVEVSFLDNDRVYIINPLQMNLMSHDDRLVPTDVKLVVTSCFENCPSEHNKKPVLLNDKILSIYD